MLTQYKKYSVLIMLFLFLGCMSNCKVPNSEQQDLTFVLETSFEKISLAKYGLNYPHTKHSLDRCIEYNDRECLDTYHQVAENKNTIQSLAQTNSKSLATTLDIIESACLSKNENIANFVCYGGIMSLYFYDSPEQDAGIRARIKKYPKEIRNRIFNNNFFWYSNRPDVDAWVTYISVAVVDWSDESQKRYTADRFKKRIEEIDEDAWVRR